MSDPSILAIILSIVSAAVSAFGTYLVAQRNAKKDETVSLPDRYSKLFDSMEKRIKQLEHENEECYKRDEIMQKRIADLENRLQEMSN
jgi:hypothetical protein